jgi:cobalt/nickel transport system permease protein
METIEIDQYSRNSTLYRFDPRVKFASTVAFVVTLSFMRDINALIIALVFIILLLVVSKIPFRHFFKAFSMALPFIAVASIALFFTSGAQPAIAMALRISTSVMALLLLITTTPFFDILKALRWFRVPYMFCSLLLFTYRYIFVIMEELELMNMARKSRGFSLKGNLFSKDIFQTISFTAGMVLVRSYERSKRIYDGLLARGFRGEIHTLRPPRARPRDAIYTAVFASTIIIISFIQWGVVTWTL